MEGTRALLTETERRYIATDGDPQRRYDAAARLRRRINEQLVTDIEVLKKGHPKLLGELRSVVCNDHDGRRPPVVMDLTVIAENRPDLLDEIRDAIDETRLAGGDDEPPEDAT